MLKSEPVSDVDSDELSLDIRERASETGDNLLTIQSRLKYEAAYNKFMQWRADKKINTFSETVLLNYFHELAEKFAPPSLWAIYSMLKSIIHKEHNINIHDYAPLTQFLKEKSKGYVAKKANVLSPSEIQRFIKEAPDDRYLAVKVALIFGVEGACRKHELCDMTIDNIEDKGDKIIVTIPTTKNDESKSFVIPQDFYHIYKKYADLRPSKPTSRRFFLQYRYGKCSRQVIGINTIGSMPKTVAQFLKLDKPETYTGHTFRRTSATLVADRGGALLAVKRHGNWGSDKVTESNEEDSTFNEKRIKIENGMDSTTLDYPTTSTTTTVTSTAQKQNEHREIIIEKMSMGHSTHSPTTIHLNISNCNNLSIYFGDHKGS